MTMLAVSKRALSQFAAVGLVAAVCLAAWLFIVSPLWHRIHDGGEAVEKQQLVLARLEAIAAYRDKLSKFKHQLNNVAQKAEFYSGDSTAVVMARLQSQLKSTATKSKAVFRSATPLPAIPGEQFDLIGLRIEIQGTTQSIFATVYAIESAIPYLVVRRAVIATQQAVVLGRQPARDQALRAQLDIFGARLERSGLAR